MASKGKRGGDGMRRALRAFLCAVFAWSMVVPVAPARADEVADGSADAAARAAVAFDFEPGTYVEHEAIAYVADAAAQAFSWEKSVLDGAETLMEVDATAAAEALGGGAGADGRAGVFSLDGGSAGGQLVLVHNDGLTTEQLIAELEADPRVAFAEPNTLVTVDDEEAADADTAAAADFAASATGVAGLAVGAYANMEAFQWPFANDGHMDGLSSSEAIDMEYAAWNDPAAAGSLDEVVVAVVDSGVDETNPDLASVMWRDGLKYPNLLTTGKEDACGFCADNSTGATSTTYLDSPHGTHVAGIIGAAWDGQGVSGLAPNVKIMAVRFDNTMASTFACFDYIVRACKEGVNVRVANNSWTSDYGTWRSLDVALTALGQQGVVSVFSSGNSAYDNDHASSTALQLTDNPYVLEVNSYDSSGDASLFTQYGQTTTDVMAPGSAFLSTYRMTDLSYLGEADADATLYQSFDSESHVAPGADPANVTFGAGMVTRGVSFDGEGALALPYDPSALGPETNYYVDLLSDPISLASVAEKPEYFSIRYKPVADDGGKDVAGAVSVSVKTTMGWGYLEQQAPFGMADAWTGFYAELPDDTDWEHFRIVVSYQLCDYTLLGGVEHWGESRSGTLFVDSIGLGSSPVPYLYESGTSMACPSVAGAAAVLAGQGKADVADGDKAKSAEKLAAAVKGAAVPTDAFDALCSTGGYATVDGASDLGPAMTRVVDEGDTVAVEGYFMDASSAVSLDGVLARVAACIDMGDGKVRLIVEKPAEFAGGQALVCVQATVGEAAGKKARESANLGKATGVSYYDQTDLPLPDELSEWRTWSLVGFNGSLYCLPHEGDGSTVPGSYVLRFDTVQQSWSQVGVPLSALYASGMPEGESLDMTGTTIGGALVVQCVGASGVTRYLRHTADGVWELLEFGFTGGQQDDAGPVWATLAGDGERAYLFGGARRDDTGTLVDNTTIYEVDFSGQRLVAVGELASGALNPLVAYSNGRFVVTNGLSGETLGGVQGAQLVTQVGGEWTGAPIDFTAFTANPTGRLGYAAGAVTDGFMIAGPVSDDGTADTYVLSTGVADEALGAAAGASVGVASVSDLSAYESVLHRWRSSCRRR